MANSIKEYPAVASALHTYTTPAYLNVTDIKVYVDDVLQTEGYVINGEALNFTNGHLPQADQTVRIERQSDASSRLVSYTDGSLLNAETLDKDANHIFNVAQEAYDQSRETNMAAGKFYFSQEAEPENPEAGTLWYQLNSTVNELQVWNGDEWQAATPVKDTQRFTKDDFTAVSGTADKLAVTMNQTSEAFLNGVKLVRGSIYSDVFTNDNADYYYDTQQGDFLWTKDLASDDVLEIISYTGGYATTVLEAEERINELVTSAEGFAAASSQINVDINSDFSDLIKFVEAPEDSLFYFQGSPKYSALHYSEKSKDSAEQSNLNAAAALGSLNKAINYATKGEDEAFTDDDGNTVYSALHYSKKAEASIATTQGLIDTLNLNVGAITQLKSDSEAAQGKAEDAQGLAETAQGHAETAQGHAETAQGLAENAATLSEKYADHEGAFDVNGEEKFSAKHYADQVTFDISNITGVVQAADSLADSLRSNINHPSNHLIDDGTGTAFYSARHYADQAAAFANQSVDALVGWDLKDANTISTTTDGTPVFHSSTTLDINATGGVRANHVPLPIYGGVLHIQGDYLGFGGTTVTKNGNVFNIVFDTPFPNTKAYQVSATYSGNNRATVRVVKSSHGFSVSATEVDSGAESLSGEIVVTVYKFT